MEYCQSSNSLLQTTSPSGIVESPFHGTSANEHSQINSICMGSGLNSNASCISMYSQSNPSATGESVGPFLGNTAPSQSPEGSHFLTPTTYSSLTGRLKKKHKHQRDDYDCPLKKRKLSSSHATPVLEGCPAPSIFVGDSPQPYWDTSHSQVKQAPVVPALRDQSSEIMHTVFTEDMEEVAVESQSDAALRRIRDIERRLIVEEDDDEEAETTNGRLPTLIMSDVLVEGLKKELDESLTKKIVDSINRPSMELVLWKPQPEFLIDKLQSIASSYKDDPEVSKQAHATPKTSFFREVDPSSADKPCTSNLDCDIDTMWNREEEEMEL